MSKIRPSFTDLARTAWGDPPDWIEALAREADRTSATMAARNIGYSTGAVSSVIRKSYKGNLDAVAAKVRGALLGQTVVCPVLGEMRRDRCITEQKKDFTGTSAIRTRLHKACRGGCPHSRLKGAQS